MDADLLDGKHATEMVPSGLITLWSGSIVSVLAGLCDGANGTPHLCDRFVVGAATHTHAITVDGAGTGLTIGTTTATVNGDGDPPNALTSATPIDPQYTHTASAANADSRPPYFALAYIMKL